MKTLRSSALGLLLALPAWTTAQEEQSLPGRGMTEVPQGQVMKLVGVCESCHGAGGQTTRLDVPPLAGKSAEFILSSLEQFYYYERHCPDVEFENDQGKLQKMSMCDIVNDLSRPEALALGHHFENMPPAGD